jgi:hypothetical protein
VEFDVRGTRVVALQEHTDTIRTALRSRSLYDYAAQHEDARGLSGRGIAYAVPLPNGLRVVVRHNRHGGLLAPLTGDRFLSPTRAPYELAMSQRLIACGVPTPAIVAYAIYRAEGPFRRSDVASLEVSNSTDLSAILVDATEAEREAALDAAASLIALLSACGARHHDLNVKNVLLARGDSRGAAQVRPYLLDVDRVEFKSAGASRVTQRNLDRFLRSARKWRALHGARIDEAELERLVASVKRAVSSAEESGRPARTRS